MKVGILFPGYTSQFVGMGKDFYDQSRLMQEYFEEASNCLTINFVKLCFASSDSELSKGLHANTSLFLVGASIVKIMQEQGINPTIAAGNGIGQFTALFAAGGINVPDGLYLIAKYSHFLEELQQTQQYKVVTVHNISLKSLQQLCMQYQAIISSYNDLHEFTVCVHESKLLEFTQSAKAIKAKTHKIASDFGYYAPFCESISMHLKMYLEKVDCTPLNFPVLNTQSGKIVTSSTQIKKLIAQLAHTPIKWQQSLKKFSDCDIIVEIAPTGSVKQQLTTLYPHKIIHAISKPEDIETLRSRINTLIEKPCADMELTQASI